MTYLPAFKHIRSDVGIYLFYAGKSRRFFEETKALSALFLDLPGFTADDVTFANDAEIIKQIYRARAARKFIKNPIENPRPQSASSYPSQIPENGKKLDRNFLAEFVNTKILFTEIKAGDLVVLTPGNHYDPVLLGEVISGWESDQFLSINDFGDYTTPFRQVKWVQHGLARSDFAREVGRRMQNRRTVTRIDELYYENIFKLIYPRYVWGNTSKIDVFAETYSSNDPTATFESSFLIKYAVALYAATEAGRADEFLKLDKQEAADRFFDPELVDQMIQSFGSPGGYVARFRGAAVAVFVAAVIAISLSDESQPVNAVSDDVLAEYNQQKDADQQVDHSFFADSIRAGSDEELRRKYGRPARAKLGLTLEGETPPEIRSRELHR